MPKTKYYIYSTDTLGFKEIYSSNFHKILSHYPLGILGILIGILLFLVGSAFITTPEEKRRIQKEKILKQEIQQMNARLKEFEGQIEDFARRDDSLYRIILGSESLPTSIKIAGKGGSNTISETAKHDELIAETSERLEALVMKAKVLQYSYSEVSKAAKKNHERLLHTPAIMPIYNKDLTGTGAGFGMRHHPILGITRMHEGIDFYAGTGTEVYASANGTVKSCHYSRTFGNLIILDHGWGIETYYAHLSVFKAKKGQKVSRGEIIGLVGNTGLSSGPHLHYEVHLNGKEVNPVHYFFNDLSPAEYQQMLSLVGRNIQSMD